MTTSTLRAIFRNQVSIGSSTGVRRGFIVQLSTDEARLKIGNNCSFNNFCSINVRESVSIGNDCILGEGVRIYDHDHVFNELDLRTREQGFTTAPVVIEDNCWLGSNVVVLKGVVVGRGSVIGAGAVLSRSVEPGTILVARQEHTLRTREQRPRGFTTTAPSEDC